MLQLSQKEIDALLKCIMRSGSHSGEVYILYRRPSSRVFLSYTKHNLVSKTGCRDEDINTIQIQNNRETFRRTLHYFLETSNDKNYTPKLVISSTNKDFEVRNLFSISEFNFDNTILGNFYEINNALVVNKLMTVNKFIKKEKNHEKENYRVLFRLKNSISIKNIEKFFESIKINKKTFSYFSSTLRDGTIYTGSDDFFVEGIDAYSFEPRPGVKISLLRSKDYRFDGVVEILAQQHQTIQGAVNDFFEILGSSEVEINLKKPDLGKNEYSGFKSNSYLFMKQPYDFLYNLLLVTEFKNAFVYEDYYYLINGMLQINNSVEELSDFFSDARGGSYYVERAKNIYEDIAKRAEKIKNKKEKIVFYVFNEEFFNLNAITQSFSSDELVLKNLLDLNSIKYVCIVSFDKAVFDNLIIPHVNIVIDSSTGAIKDVFENLDTEFNLRNNRSRGYVFSNNLDKRPEHGNKDSYFINNDSSIASYTMAPKDNILSN